MKGTKKSLLKIYLFASGTIGAITLPIWIEKNTIEDNRDSNRIAAVDEVISLIIETTVSIPVGAFLGIFSPVIFGPSICRYYLIKKKMKKD